MLIVLFDFFQYASIGPDFRSLSMFLHLVSSATELNVDSFTELSTGMYWVLLITLMLVVAIWTFCVLMFVARLVLKYENWICYSLIHTSDILLPFIGNALFLPIIAIHYDVFICTEGTGDEATDSFLNRDCHYYCWEDEHLGYSIAAVVSLVAYLPAAIYTRPFW